MNDQRLEEVTSFKYLGATLCKGGTCSAEVCIRIASVMAEIRLNKIWQRSTMSFASKFELYKSIVTSILLYGCETWTLLAETRCFRKLLHISYLELKTNTWVWSKINFLVGP